jgi:hypothetical protein
MGKFETSNSTAIPERKVRYFSNAVLAMLLAGGCSLSLGQNRPANAPAPTRAASDGGPTSASQVEITFWESVQNSTDPAELQAYLDQYPNGKFSSLAKLRINKLKQAAPTAAAPAPEVEAAPVSPDDPNPGDTWSYRYIDGWFPDRPQPKIQHTIVSAVDGVFVDRMTGPAGSDELTYTSIPKMVERIGRRLEFWPYFLTSGALYPGRSFKFTYVDKDNFGPWQVYAEVIGPESVVVPAGSFNAIKVTLSGTRTPTMTQANSPAPTRMKQIVWYSKQVKRVVKYMVLTSYSGRELIRDTYELESYKLGASGGSVASNAPPAPDPDLPPGLPRPGDTWTYRYTDGWRPGQQLKIQHSVVSAAPGEIWDAMKSSAGSGDQIQFTPAPTLTERAGDRVEFSPYLQAFGNLAPGRSFKLSYTTRDNGAPWEVQVRVIGAETVIVPAGEFDTVRVEVTGNRSPMGIQLNSPAPTRTYQVIWYSAKVKRAVKYVFKTSWSGRESNRDLYELESYKLN